MRQQSQRRMKKTPLFYSRRKRDNIAILISPSINQPTSLKTSIKNSPPSSNLLSEIDLDIPIAIWKGVKTCTKQPLSNHVPHHCL